MNLLNKLTIKSLKLNKKRTIVTIIGIMLSVALITAVTALFFSANASLINFEIRQKGNYHYSFKEVPISDIKNFTNNRHIDTIYKIANIGYAKLSNSKNENKPYAYIRAFEKEALSNLAINLVSGRLPENDQEILIPTHLKTNGRITYEVGDTITLDVGKRVDSEGYELTQDNPYFIEEDNSSDSSDEQIIDSTTKTYKIVGIIERPSNSIESYSAPGFTFITILKDYKDYPKVDLYVRYDKEGLKDHDIITANILGIDEKLYTKFQNGEIYSSDNYEEELENIQNELDKAKYQYDSNNYLIKLESGILKESSMQSLALVVLVVIIIIIVTSVFCIKNSFDISITEKIKQYGMLASIGATKKQIKKNVYYEALILALIGIPLGIICGLLASYILIIISNYFLKDMMNLGLIFKFSIYPLIIAIALGFVTIFLSAMRSARRASKISPITAIRNSENIKIKAKKLKSPRYIKKIFGIGGDVSYKNLKRNRQKYRTTVISIIVCVSVFIALYYFINLAFVYTQKELSSSEYNISLDYNLEDNKGITSKIDEILTDDSIKNYAISRNSYITIESYKAKYSKEYLKYYPDINDKEKTKYTYENDEGKIITNYEETSISIVAIGKKAYNEYLKSLNLSYDEAKDKGILINYEKASILENNKSVEKTLSVYNYKKGDILNWNFEGGDKTLNIELVKVTNKYPFSLENMNYSTLLIISDELYDKLDSDIKDSVSIYIDSDNASKLQDEIDLILKDFDYSLNNIEENVRMMESFYTLIAIFLYGFITVIALIGITNIFNTITTNMELRSREFATLKSIGMTTKEFNRMIRLESFFYGTKSLIIGIPIGCLLAYIIYRLLSADDSSMYFELPYPAILITIIAVFLLIACIMKYSIKKINKQNTIETIRNENI